MKEQSSRDKILQVAANEFAEKGFSGARVDEIAKAAGVPKSLIYYHFKSKDEILEVLLARFIEEYEMILDSASEVHTEENMRRRMQEVYYEFGERNADIIRILWMDALKKGNEKKLLYKILDSFMDKEKQATRQKDKSRRRIEEFFTSILPACAYICFKESWCSYYKEDEEQFNEDFLSAYVRSHNSLHEARENEE